MRERNTRFAVKALSLGISLAIYGGASFASSNSLPRINVMGQGAESISKQPGSILLIEKEQIEQQQPLSTEDVLRRVSGINVKGEEESAVVVNFGMRGLSADAQKTLVLEDGVPIQPSLFLGNGRYYNPRIQRMEGVEVLKGASSLRYGPNTIGGVINYQTKQPEDGVAISGRVGSHNLKEGNLELGASSKSGDAMFGIFYTKAESDGWMDKGYKLDDLMVKSGIQIDDNQWLSMKFSHTENEANISYRGLFLDDYKAKKTYNPAPDDFFITERNSFDINHEWDINNQLKLNTLVYWSELTREYWRFKVKNNNNESPTAGRWNFEDDLDGKNRAFERKGAETRLDINHNSFGINNQAEVGVRVLDEQLADLSIGATRANPRSETLDKENKHTAKSVSAFAQNRFDLNDKLSITAGLRVEKYEQKMVDLQDHTKSGSTSNTEFMPGLGLTYQLAPMAQVYTSVYRAFNPAQSKEALDGFTDQELDAERSINIELGLRGANDKLHYEATLFQMDFDNQIVQGNSDPNLLRSNAGETLHQGLELAAGYKLNGGFSLEGNLTYIPTSEFRTNEDGNKGNRITYSPEILANLALAYKKNGLATELSLNHTGSQYGSSDNREEISGNNGGIGGIWGGKLDSYTTLNLTARYQVDNDLAVFGAVKNLTDEHYISGLRQGIYVGPERSFELGAKYKF